MIPRLCRCRHHYGSPWSCHTHNVGGKFICNTCYLRNENLFLWSSWWDRHPRLRWPVLIAFVLYIVGGAVCFTIAMSRLP